MRQKLTYEIREIRERFKDLFEYSLDLIYAHDLNGKFLDANDIALSTLGFTREEISNISFRKLIDNDQLEKAFNVLKEINEFGRQKDPSEYKLKDRYGNRIYLETYGIPLKTNDQIFGILGIAKDITSKKKAELELKQAKQDLEKLNLELENRVRKKTQKLEKSVQKLKSSEEKLHDLIETSSMGFLEIDLEKEEVKYINPKFMEILGLERKELEERQLFHKIISSEDFKELINTRESRDVEFRVISKNNEIKWLSGTRVFQYNSIEKPINLRLWVQDISSIKESELKLKKSEINLKERVKELTCLYELSKLYENPEVTIEKIIHGTLDLIPSAWQFSDSTCARIIYNGRDFKTSNFKETEWRCSTKDTIGKKKICIEIYYLEDRPFLGEEQNLLNEIANRLKVIIEKKETEQELRKSEERYRRLLENAHEGVWVVDENDYTIFVNSKMCEMLGYTRDEIMGKRLHLFLEDSMIELINSYRKSREKGSKDTYELEFIKKDGSLLSTRINAAPILNEKGKFKGSFAFINDITNRKITEQKLKESEEKYRLITESISDPLHVINSDLKIIYLNPAFTNWLKALGLNHEVIGKNPTEAFPFIEKNVNNEYQEIFNSKKELFLEGYSILNNKRIFTETKKIPVLNDGKVIQIITIVRDVSERKEIDLKLRESEEKYRSILESINEGYFEVDFKGNLTFFNDALCLSTGYSREELLNKSYTILFDEKTAEDVFRIYNELYQRGKGSILFDYQVIRKDGSTFYHESSIYLRYDSNGKIIGFKGFVRDISEKKKVETLRERFSQELEKEVELKTKELKVAFGQQRLYLDKILKASHFQTEFMARISHELRTPLNAIIGFTALLLEGVYGQLNVEQLDFIKDIEESSKDLLNMISNILDISKIESGQVILKIENIQISNLIQQIISTLNPLYSEKNLKFELKGLKKNQVIFVDRIKFKQIIFNLLSNAIKFTEKGTIIFEFLDHKDKWEFKVKDMGVGIANEDFDIIFKEFKRVRSTYVDSTPGSGLGLALTKKLVNLHGGDISFKSKLGKGSTFTFFIPKKLEMSYNNSRDVTQFLDLL